MQMNEILYASKTKWPFGRHQNSHFSFASMHYNNSDLQQSNEIRQILYIRSIFSKTACLHGSLEYMLHFNLSKQ